MKFCAEIMKLQVSKHVPLQKLTYILTKKIRMEDYWTKVRCKLDTKTCNPHKILKLCKGPSNGYS